MFCKFNQKVKSTCITSCFRNLVFGYQYQLNLDFGFWLRVWFQFWITVAYAVSFRFTLAYFRLLRAPVFLMLALNHASTSVFCFDASSVLLLKQVSSLKRCTFYVHFFSLHLILLLGYVFIWEWKQYHSIIFPASIGLEVFIALKENGIHFLNNATVCGALVLKKLLGWIWKV
jgi:hypothetical protein